MEVAALQNIGKAMQQKLAGVGITTAEQLKAMGSRQAFFLLKVSYPEVCLVYLYALQAAIEDIDMKFLSAQTKKELKAYCDSLT